MKKESGIDKEKENNTRKEKQWETNIKKKRRKAENESEKSKEKKNIQFRSHWCQLIMFESNRISADDFQYRQTHSTSRRTYFV